MPTTDPLSGWRLPTLPDPADGPDGLSKLASDAATSVFGVNISTYTPTWASDGPIQPVSPASKIGKFRSRQGWCDVYLYLGFNSSSGGGAGSLYLTLPITPSASYPRQWLRATLWIPGIGQYLGAARVGAGSLVVYPYFPRTDDSNIQEAWANTNNTAAAGTGVPVVSGSYGVRDTGELTVSGRYLVA